MKNKNDQNKNSCGKFLIMLALIFIFFSCDKDFLQEKPMDFLAVNNAYNRPEDIEMGISALHENTRNWFAQSSYTYLCLNAWGTDLSFLGDNPGLSNFMQSYPISLTPEHRDNKFFWDRAYTLIQNVNVLLDAISRMDEDLWIDQNKKNMFIAEAKFFRAFAYRQNVILYGDITLVTDVIDFAKTDFIRNPKADIYALIESDLSFATVNLPSRGNESTPGRITQGAAWHLLSEIYLAQSKYQQAVDAATHVIDDYGYALMTSRFGTQLDHDVFGSGDVYYDLFREGNHNIPENTEAIWVIQIEADVIGGHQYGGERAYGPVYYRMGTTPDGFKAFRGENIDGNYTGYSDTLGRPAAWVCPTKYVKYYIWESDWDIDIRNAPHNIKRDFYFDNPESIYHKTKIDWSLYEDGTRNAIRDTNAYIFPYFQKVANPCRRHTEPARSGGGFTHQDLYAMRLAETYLLRAEAYLGLGSSQKAADDINEVRNRANATPVAPGEVTIDYILDERVRELYTEEWRGLTLIRLDKLVERTRKYNDNPFHPGADIQDHNKLWPIPQSQIDLNVNAEFGQNPGY